MTWAIARAVGLVLLVMGLSVATVWTPYLAFRLVDAAMGRWEAWRRSRRDSRAGVSAQVRTSEDPTSSASKTAMSSAVCWRCDGTGWYKKGRRRETPGSGDRKRCTLCKVSR
jgi:hypothetical protein